MYQRKVQIIVKDKPATPNSDGKSVKVPTNPLFDLSFPPRGQWLRVAIPSSYQPTYLSPNRFILRQVHHDKEFREMQKEMDAHYAIISFTKEKRDKRGVIGEDRLQCGAIFAAYVKDLRAWGRVVVKAPNGGK